MISYIDSHAHITSESIYGDVDLLIENAKAARVDAIVNICTDKLSLERGLLVKSKYEGTVFLTAATTPHDVEKEGELLFPLMRKHAMAGDLVAVGETGLDYYYDHAPKDLQQLFLKRYLALAVESKLPVVIHCREAFADLFAILDSDYCFQGSYAPGILHCFTGTVEEADQVLKRGFFLSLSGIVTFKNSHALREVAKMVPLDRLLIETDAPYLAPQSRRGQRNEPAFLPEIASCIASVKGVSPGEVAHASYRNAERVFGLPVK